MAFFGLAVVAIGAEIPDTIQSVTVAKKGYGSMAVSNGLGSQICNICVGLGASDTPPHPSKPHWPPNVAMDPFHCVSLRFIALRCSATFYANVHVPVSTISFIGMPWTLSTSLGNSIYVSGPGQITAAAMFQFVNISINFSLLLGAALVLKQNKAELTREKGLIFLGTYFVILSGCKHISNLPINPDLSPSLSTTVGCLDCF